MSAQANGSPPLDLSWLSAVLGLSELTVWKLLLSVTAIVLLWVLRSLILRLVFGRVDDVKIRYQWKKATTYVTVIVGTAIVARIWFGGFQSIATYLGLLSAGLAIALKDLVVNLAGWGFIIWRRPFEVGDRIQIGEVGGDVIDLRIFQFTLMEIGNWVHADQSTGRIVHISNGHVFTQNLANYTKGFQFIWHEIPVLITFESAWEEAKAILQSIADEHSLHLSQEAEARVRKASQKYMIFYRRLTPIVYTSVVDSGVLLTIRYLCDPRTRRGTEMEIWEAILRAFAARDDIDFAYPTQRFYSNREEGKPGSGGPPHTSALPDG